MTIKFPTVEDILKTHSDELSNWGYPSMLQLTPADMTKAYLEKVRDWSADSKTALATINFVERALPEVSIVGMRGGETSFDSDCPVRGKGVIYVNLDLRMGIRGSNVDMHQYVALLHEFGHAKQWIERPEFFSTSPLETSAFKDMIEKSAAEFFQKRILAAQGREFKKMSVDEMDEVRVKNLGLSNLMVKKENWRQRDSIVRIESDNLARHEWPICDEKKMPRRNSYADLIILAPEKKK